MDKNNSNSDLKALITFVIVGFPLAIMLFQHAAEFLPEIIYYSFSSIAIVVLWFVFFYCIFVPLAFFFFVVSARLFRVPFFNYVFILAKKHLTKIENIPFLKKTSS